MQKQLTRQGTWSRGIAWIAVVTTGFSSLSSCGPNYVLQSEAKKKLGMSDQEILAQELAESEAALAASGGRGAQALPNTAYLNNVDGKPCTHFVSTTGNDANPGTSAAPWRTIAKAFSTLSAGQVACVRAGTYSNDKGTTARSGTATAPIVVRAEDPNNRPVLFQGFVGFTQAYWVVDGLRININKLASMGARFTPTSSFSTLRNSEVINSAGGAAISIEGKDIFMHKVVSFGNIKPADDSHAVVVQTPAARVLIKDLIAYNNSGDAFQCLHGYDTNLATRPADITVEGGQMYNEPAMYTERTEQAFDIKQCTRVTIRGINIKQYRGAGAGGLGTSGVIHVGAENVLVERNTFSDVETGINIFHDTYGVNQVTVRYNIFKNIIKNASGKGGNGFNFGRGTNLEAYNNTFDGMAGTAITVGTVNWPATSGSTKNADIYNNVIANSAGSISVSTTTAPDFESDYNLFFNAPKPSNGQERNSLVANPMFLTDGSYRTASGSPARDSAFSIPLPQCSAGQTQGCYCGVRGDRGAMESDCGSVTQPTSSPTITPTITPTVSPTVTPTSGTALPISGITGSAGTMVGGEANLAVDGNMTSYWACSGTTGGCHLTVDLGASKGVGGMEIAWHLGDQRVETFAISVSSDGVSYAQVFSGRSSGTTVNFEKSAFTPRLARYVRLIGYGNSASAWNSVKELRVLSGVVSTSPSPSPTVTPTVTPTITPTGTPPAPGAALPVVGIQGSPGTMADGAAQLAIDGDMVSYWACSGTTGGCYVIADLGSERSVAGVDLAWHLGNQRVATFAVSVSRDGASYTSVYSGKSSGTSLDFERTAFFAKPARYVKITGYGNSVSAWNSIKELRVLADASYVPPSPAPSTGSINFAVVGDYGNRASSSKNVANLVKGWNPQFVITTGDNNYDVGAASTIDASIGQYYQQYIGSYKGSYGPGAGAVNRFFPSLGNHDWGTGSVSPYTNYFTLPGNERYYTFVQGPVQFFAIDSDPHEPDGTSASSTQAMWLKAQLAASTAAFKVVYFHHPSYSSGAHQSATWMRWPFREWGASIVFAGHEHSYERVVVSGFPYVIQGSGGAGLRSFGTTVSGSVYRNASDHGASKCAASSTQLKCEFWGGTSTSTGLSNLRLLDTVTLIK